MASFFNKPLRTRIIRGFSLALLLSFLAYVTPTPYLLQAPGQVSKVSDIITIDHKTYPSTGSFLLPTVVAEPASVLYCLYGMLDPDAVLIKEPSTSAPQAQTSSPQQMELSQYLSSLVALEAAGEIVPMNFQGIRVLSLEESSPNTGKLQPGDLIYGIEKTPLKSFSHYRKLLEKKGVSAEVRVSVTRKGRQTELTLSSYQASSRIVLGLQGRPELKNSSLPFPITFKSGNTIGASGGLVFALEIYDKLTPKDLTRGRKIAATGTLDASGTVGPIEGIAFKFKGARRAGADLFLIPKENLKDIAEFSEEMTVMPVTSFKEAITILEK